MLARRDGGAHGLGSKPGAGHLYARPISSADRTILRTPVPGPMFTWVKRASYLELALFAALIVVWVAPGFESETAALGLAHGLGFVALAILIWIAVIRHEAPYTLLAATLTPVGPVGSVIAIRYIERRPPGIDGTGEQRRGGTAKGVTRPAP